MPRRSIYGQTKRVGLMVKWCESTNSKGLIVCLDQEKAYDGIELNYLWQTLKAFGFPAQFIKRIKNLYIHASTSICINGCERTV